MTRTGAAQEGTDPGAPASADPPGSAGSPPTAQALATAYREGSTDPVAELDACLARIGALDGQLGAVLTTDPRALDAARASARRLRAGRPRSALEGVPVLVKDNIETAGSATTAGSRLLSGLPFPVADAPLVARLRRAGAIVVGKANLSEWSNFRSTSSTSGWSGVGGQTRNPHVLDHDPSGSSSGSAAAVAAGYTPLAVGTETDGSILSPGAHCGIVGMKPTLGLVSRTGVVPISSAQDTAGPLPARSPTPPCCWGHSPAPTAQTPRPPPRRSGERGVTCTRWSRAVRWTLGPTGAGTAVVSRFGAGRPGADPRT